ncbi:MULTISPECIES: hypothetical protein [Polaromonas]|uniref:Uncharacterized protein n=1 Tax=Polaromonas aquatica TaxID=332657 RepID=A0ABW1U0V7_9BURK
MQLKNFEAPSVAHRVRCDRCGKELPHGKTSSAGMISVGFDAGQDSVFGEGNRVEVDLCETCLQVCLGAWLRVRLARDTEQIPREVITTTGGRGQPAAANRDRDRFKHQYGTLTFEEMAGRMECTPEVIREQEAAGQLFAADAQGRGDGPRYPTFQLNENLDRPMLKQIIKEYREAGVSMTRLWSFLRTPQKFFAGFTPMEMLLGCSFPEYEALTPEERCAAFLDLVADELSRTRF